MSLLSKDELKEQGWEEPLDESPADNPDGWYWGSVSHTGGGIFCRIWSTRESVGDRGDDEPDTYFEVIYGTEFDGVGVNRYEYNDTHNEWQLEETTTTKLHDERTDSACANLAAELMEQQDTP